MMHYYAFIHSLWFEVNPHKFYQISHSFIFSPLTNFGIEEDQDEPKEAAHLDYKYLKSYEGPLAKPIT